MHPSTHELNPIHPPISETLSSGELWVPTQPQLFRPPYIIEVSQIPLTIMEVQAACIKTPPPPLIH